jgi:hypothetical protein
VDSNSNDSSTDEKKDNNGNFVTRTIERVGEVATEAGSSMRKFLSANQKPANEGGTEASPEASSDKETNANNGAAPAAENASESSSFFTLPTFFSGSTTNANNTIKDDMKNLTERLQKEKEQLIHNREEIEEAIRELMIGMNNALKDLKDSNAEIQQKINSIDLQQTNNTETTTDNNVPPVVPDNNDNTTPAPDSSSYSSTGSSDSSDFMSGFNSPTEPPFASPEPPSPDNNVSPFATPEAPSPFASPEAPSPFASPDNNTSPFATPDNNVPSMESPDTNTPSLYSPPAATPAYDFNTPALPPPPKTQGATVGGKKHRTRKRRSRRSSRR